MHCFTSIYFSPWQYLQGIPRRRILQNDQETPTCKRYEEAQQE